jgi:hypothetical protein
MATGNSYTEISVNSKATVVTFELNKQRKPTTKRPFLLNFDYKGMASYLHYKVMASYLQSNGFNTK